MGHVHNAQVQNLICSLGAKMIPNAGLVVLNTTYSLHQFCTVPTGSEYVVVKIRENVPNTPRGLCNFIAVMWALESGASRPQGKGDVDHLIDGVKSVQTSNYMHVKCS